MMQLAVIKVGVNAVQSLQEHDSSVENKVCREQGSLPNKDQKQSKRNYMSLFRRDVIALSGLVERNMNQLPPNSCMCI